MIQDLYKKVEIRFTKELSNISFSKKHDWQWAKSVNNIDKQTRILPVIFPSFLILEALTRMKSKIGAKLSKRNQFRVFISQIASWLYAQQSDQHTFNWWQAYSPIRQKRPYPDDLDDTFCAWTAINNATYVQTSIVNSNKNIIQNPMNADVLAMLTSLLCSCEKSEGGPYWTWNVSDNKENAIWHDCDPIVNCNIATFLAAQNVTLPNQLDFINTEICKRIEMLNTKNGSISRYYPSFFICAYFYFKMVTTLPKSEHARFLTSFQRMKKQLLHLISSENHSAHESALLLSALLWSEQFQSTNNAKNINVLVKNICENPWIAGDICIDQINKKQVWVAQNRIATTALCIQALDMFMQTYTNKQKVKQSRETLLKRSCKNELISITKQFRQTYSKDMEMIIHHFLCDKNVDEVLLLPSIFATALGKKSAQKKKKSAQAFSNHFLQQLGVANALGWIALTIIDDVMDNPTEPSTQNLPIAVFFFHKAHALYDSFFTKNMWAQKIFRQFMDRALTMQTRAYIREQKKTKYVKKTATAEKSFCFSLGIFVLLFSRGYLDHSTITVSMRRFVFSYLAAKQMNDDLHDWQDDWKSCRHTPVTQMLAESSMDIQNDADSLHQYFWTVVFPKTCNVIQDCIHVASRALARAHLPFPQPLEAIIYQQQQLLDKGKQDASQAIEFAKKISSLL